MNWFLESGLFATDYIPAGRLPVLRQYKYQGVDKSVMSNPNLITLIGFMHSLAGFIVVMLYSRLMTSPLPAWGYVLIAYVLFMYMTFDAVDGKQARRTGSSSPLGQLFDHGCDAINLIFTVFMTWAVFGFDPSLFMSVNACLTYLVFVCSTWEEYHTHCLYLGYFNGPVEGSLTVSLAALASCVLGRDIWKTKLASLMPLPAVASQYRLLASGRSLHGVTLQDLMVGLILLVATGSLTASVRNVVRLRGIGAIKSLVAAIAPIYLSLTWFSSSPSLHTALGYVMFCLYAGFLATNAVFRIILATVTRAPYPYFIGPYWSLAGLLAHRGLASSLPGGLYHIDDRLVLGLALTHAVLANVHCGLSVIRQVCRFLDIPCLTLPTRAKAQ